MHKESIFNAAIELCIRQKRRYGGFIVHLGVVFCFLAFAGNSLKIEKDVSLKLGESVAIGDYTLTYTGLTERNDREKTLIIASMPVHQNGKLRYDLHPGKAIFHASPQMPTSEIDIRSTPLEDVYVALVNYDPTGSTAAFKVFISPFTWWFWFGGVTLVLGTLICLWPTRDSLDKLRLSPTTLGRAAVFGAAVALVVSPLIVWTVESETSWGSSLRFNRISLEASTIPAPNSTSTLPPHEIISPDATQDAS